jgi:large subunit ribosomal protein L25
MKNEQTLTLEPRAVTGSTSARASRRAGKIPAVLYGHGAEPRAVAVDAKALAALLHGGGKTHLLNVVLAGSRDTAILRAIARDPVSHKPIHVDFQRVGASESITAELPVVTVGVAPGVRDFGGVLDVITHAVEVSGPANALPEHVEVDVSKLGIRDHVVAADLRLPAGFKLGTPPETIIVSVEPSRTAAQVEEAATGTTLQQSEVASVKPEKPPEGT